ncbi:thiamine pyrophosphate-dependent dehydrogenase E1 component subunit alpha [Alphaproteobacteria bacterium]|nr:thiamine pyrophosphate-dependent dehydrogenase E1 component subunit alpha [Alphaproteobacteria bacterium]
MVGSKLIRECVRIRLVEEKIIDLYPSDLIQSPVHLSIGQEAAAVGLCAALKPQDKIFINYRGHAMYLARGGDLKKFFSELMGRETGICKGKGGSMHLADPSNGIMGASAVVGSTISHAVGAALANKVKKGNSIFVTNFGDGATEQGVLHECLNLAALFEVPVLFLCEDNGLAVHARKHERQKYDLEKLVGAYGIRFADVEKGNDPEEVYRKTALIVKEVRDSGKPSFLRIHTARYLEHVGPNDDLNFGYRSEAELEPWKKSDPCFEYIDKNAGEVEKISAEIEEAVKFALNSAVTPSSELTTDV